MQWWQIALVLVDLYLLLSLAPAIAAQVLIYLLQRHGPLMDIEAERLQSIISTLQRQQAYWPTEPRAGLYQEIDEQAQRQMRDIDALVARIEPRIASTASRELTSLTLTQALTLQGWLPLLDGLRLWNERRTVRALLTDAEARRMTLRELDIRARAIPDQVRNALNEARAEVNRLTTLAEEEQAQGTIGMDAALRALNGLGRETEHDLDQLADTDPQELPTMVALLTENSLAVREQLSELDEGIQRVTEMRRQATNTYDRLSSAIGVLQERWEGLKQRRVTEAVLGRAVEEMTRSVALFGEYLQQHTFEGYARLVQLSQGMDEQIEVVAQQMDHIDDLLGRARASIEGDVRALSEAQATLQKLRQQFPLFEPDQSQALIESASRMYLEAEHQVAQGTVKGYETAIQRAEVAHNHLSEALQLAAPVADQIAQVKSILANLSAETIGGWRSRALRVQDGMQVYTQHWDAGPSSDITEALAGLEQVEIDIERVPPNVRYQRSFRQSELSQAAEILAHAQKTMQHAQELVVQMEQEYERVADRRSRLEQDLETLTSRVIPGIELLKPTMLPELAERYQALATEVAQRLQELCDPNQTDYDEALDTWLPNMARQFQEIRTTHENDQQHYRKLADEAVERIQRAWDRLDRIEPREVPGPAQSIDELEADVNAYLSEANQRGNDPKLLQQVVGRRAQVLEQRIEDTLTEIIQGRKTLDGLARQYRRRIQSLRALRTRVNALAQGSQWPQLPWDVGQAEQVWTQIMALERDSHTSPYLTAVNDQMQKALNVSLEAEQLYDALETQMSKAFDRLDNEQKAINAALERTRRRIDRLRDEGDEEQTVALQTACDAAMRYVEMAQAATTFEDAYRHLREAEAVLTRM